MQSLRNKKTLRLFLLISYFFYFSHFRRTLFSFFPFTSHEDHDEEATANVQQPFFLCSFFFNPSFLFCLPFFCLSAKRGVTVAPGMSLSKRGRNLKLLYSCAQTKTMKKVSFTSKKEKTQRVRQEEEIDWHSI